MCNLVVPARLALPPQSAPTHTTPSSGGCWEADSYGGGECEIGVLVPFCETEECVCGGGTGFECAVECVQGDFQIDDIVRIGETDVICFK